MCNQRLQQHQRHLLHYLGVIQWIERTTQTQQITSSIWRENQIDPFVSLSDKPAKIDAEDSSLDIALITSQEQSTPVLDLNTSLNIESKNTPVEYQNLADTFHLYTWIGQYYVIVVNLMHTDTPEHDLWKNLIQAVNHLEQTHCQIIPQYEELLWQSTVFTLSTVECAEMYIRGFIDRLSLQKHLLVLGDIPYVQVEQATILPSLTKMIQQPESKRTVWQTVQSFYSI